MWDGPSHCFLGHKARCCIRTSIVATAQLTLINVAAPTVSDIWAVMNAIGGESGRLLYRSRGQVQVTGWLTLIVFIVAMVL